MNTNNAIAVTYIYLDNDERKRFAHMGKINLERMLVCDILRCLFIKDISNIITEMVFDGDVCLLKCDVCRNIFK